MNLASGIWRSGPSQGVATKTPVLAYEKRYTHFEREGIEFTIESMAENESVEPWRVHERSPALQRAWE